MTCNKPFEAQGSTFNISDCTSQEGFSLIELLVTILLSSIVMGAIYSVYRVQTHSMKVQENRMEAQEYARSVLDLMVREIRNAGYAPLAGTTCAGIVSADAQTLQFRYDVNADGDCADLDEDITYGFDTAGCPAGFANITRDDANDTNSAEPITDCNIRDESGKFSLAYYQKDSTTAYATPVSAVNRLLTHRVIVTITVESKNPNSEFGGQLISTMTSNVNLHNIGAQ